MPAAPEGVDLTDLDNFAHGFPHDLFTMLRREAPVFFHEPTVHTPDGEGFWSISRHSDTLGILTDPVTYSSETGGNRPYGGTILPDQVFAGQILNMMDDPRHQRIRRIVNKAFTPRMLAGLEAELRRRTHLLLDRAVEAGACDFLVEVAAELPMQATCILLGLPDTDRHQLAEWVEVNFDFKDGDPYQSTPEIQEAGAALFGYGAELITRRRRKPGDDLLSALIGASLPDVDPPTLTESELQLFFVLLFAAGADTTRNAAAGGVLALAQRPEQFAALAADRSLFPTAIEEIVRWTSPSAYNRRTVTQPVDLRGQQLSPGDKVVFWEASANRDEDVFRDPQEFDIRRSPNPHLGFGHGIHHCLGANLARLELRVLLDELLNRVAVVNLRGEPEWTRSNKHTGMRHLPLGFLAR
jgi:cytochrome P450